MRSGKDSAVSVTQVHFGRAGFVLDSPEPDYCTPFWKHESKGPSTHMLGLEIIQTTAFGSYNPSKGS